MQNRIQDNLAVIYTEKQAIYFSLLSAERTDVEFASVSVCLKKSYFVTSNVMLHCSLTGRNVP